MSTLQTHPRGHRPTTRTVLAAAGVTIAVAVGAVLLTLTDANHTQSPTTATHTQTTSPYLPTIQIPGAGLAHIVIDPRTGQAHGTVALPTRGTRPSASCLEACSLQKPHGTTAAGLNRHT
jgi:hypothetical protein